MTGRGRAQRPLLRPQPLPQVQVVVDHARERRAAGRRVGVVRLAGGRQGLVLGRRRGLEAGGVVDHQRGVAVRSRPGAGRREQRGRQGDGSVAGHGVSQKFASVAWPWRDPCPQDKRGRRAALRPGP